VTPSSSSDAAVNTCAQVFSSSRWVSGSLVSSGSDLVWSPGAQTPLVDLIESARLGTTIWTEDVQLDSQPIQQALVSAANAA
jgi:hypothetical protein